MWKVLPVPRAAFRTFPVRMITKKAEDKAAARQKKGLPIPGMPANRPTPPMGKMFSILHWVGL